jgi:hypothetical protein
MHASSSDLFMRIHAQLLSAPMTISIAMVTGLVAGLVSKKITNLDRRLLFKVRKVRRSDADRKSSSK